MSDGKRIGIAPSRLLPAGVSLSTLTFDSKPILGLAADGWMLPDLSF